MPDDVFWSTELAAARARVAGITARTPLIPSPALSERLGAEVYLKLESLQPTGSFKLRGATNKLVRLAEPAPRSSPPPGVVTFSTGNHGRAVAYVARRLGLRAVVCVSEGVPPVKLEAIRRLGAELAIVPTQDDAEALCTRLAAEQGLVPVHPFDDPDIIAGQGTIGLEILDDLPDVEAVILPLSGGGLLSGVGLALRHFAPGGLVDPPPIPAAGGTTGQGAVKASGFGEPSASQRSEAGAADVTPGTRQRGAGPLFSGPAPSDPALSGSSIPGGALAGSPPRPVQLLGVSMERGPVMFHSLRAGHPVTLPEDPSLADSLLGGIGLDNRWTFRLVGRLATDAVLVSEEAIARAMVFMLEEHGLLVEGGAATAIAALLEAAAPGGKGRPNAVAGRSPLTSLRGIFPWQPGGPLPAPRRIVVVVTGRNVDPRRVLGG